VAGVLIERVSGAPLAGVLRERVFEPLGMADTGFCVPVTGILLTQRVATSPEPAELVRDFWAAAHGAIDA